MIFKNVGWSLGNDCPLHCKQCYSKIVRNKGKNLNKTIINRVISQLLIINAQTVNLGGNEPIYTNGLNPKKSLLPYILKKLNENHLKVGITTAGPTLIQLKKLFPGSIQYINDVDISLDSPIKQEHDDNRGCNGVFDMAIETIKICKEHHIPHSIIMCGMSWNFNEKNLNKMIDLCKKTHSNFRINPLKPTESTHKQLVLSPEQFFEGLKIILKRCELIDLSDPAWACSVNHKEVAGCPCGRNSFRIHSITPEGKLPVSPCVYVHDFKYGDLLTQPIESIINSSRFQAFSFRRNHIKAISECKNCSYLNICQGGCAARAYLHNFIFNNKRTRSLLLPDPYCYKNYLNKSQTTAKTSRTENNLVHMGYLCTGIFKVIK